MLIGPPLPISHLRTRPGGGTACAVRGTVVTAARANRFSPANRSAGDLN